MFRFPSGLIAGATLMYFLDPRRGRARRKRLIDLVTHVARVERQLVIRGARDAGHRARGVIERLKPPRAVDEYKLRARIRSELGRVVSHARAIEVVVDRGGQVGLRGPILERESLPALRAVRRIPGVTGIDDHLDHTPEIATLQGAVRAPSEHSTPAARLAALGCGTALAVYGGLRPGVTGTALAAVGGALAARGMFDLPFRRLARYMLGREEIEVHKAIMVRAPIDRVFDVWTDLENFPRFMEHVHRIELADDDPLRARWTVDGPAGIPLRFETRITRVVKHREIAWRTLPGQPFAHAGVVRFTPCLEGTRLSVDMTYRPPGGVLGHTLAHLLGWDPKTRLDDDLVRVKALLEDGRTRAHGHRVVAGDVFH
jgi:uncharacterized membrane protein